MQVSFSPEQMAPLDKKCQAFTFTGCSGEEKKQERERAQPPAVKTDIPTRRKRRGGVRVAGSFLGGGGRLIVLNKGTFIFVLRPVTASGNSSVS